MRYYFLLALCLCNGASIGQDFDLIIPNKATYQVDMTNRVRLLDASLGNIEYSFYYGNANAELIDYLNHDGIRKQLEFSDTQTKEFKALQKEYGQAFKELYAKFPELKQKDIPNEARKELNRRVRLAGQKLRKEFSEKVKETLIPQQVSLIYTLKFQQMVRSFGFSHAVSNSPFSDQLKTTDKQKKELAKIRQESQEAIQKKIAEMKAEAKEKMLKVFDAQQRKKLKEIEGEKATTPKL